jgi:bifunctional non-homologous end joining protein LigD
MREFARDFATLAERRHRELFTTEQRKAKREGKILLDVGRNNFGTTSVAPYSVRARPNAPVATPLELDELSDSSTLPQRWTINNMRERLGKDGNPWRDIGKHAQSLSTARGKLDAALSET